MWAYRIEVLQVQPVGHRADGAGLRTHQAGPGDHHPVQAGGGQPALYLRCRSYTRLENLTDEAVCD